MIIKHSLIDKLHHLHIQYKNHSKFISPSVMIGLCELRAWLPTFILGIEEVLRSITLFESRSFQIKQDAIASVTSSSRPQSAQERQQQQQHQQTQPVVHTTRRYSVIGARGAVITRSTTTTTVSQPPVPFSSLANYSPPPSSLLSQALSHTNSNNLIQHSSTSYNQHNNHNGYLPLSKLPSLPETQRKNSNNGRKNSAQSKTSSTGSSHHKSKGNKEKAAKDPQKKSSVPALPFKVVGLDDDDDFDLDESFGSFMFSSEEEDIDDLDGDELIGGEGAGIFEQVESVPQRKRAQELSSFQGKPPLPKPANSLRPIENDRSSTSNSSVSSTILAHKKNSASAVKGGDLEGQLVEEKSESESESEEDDDADDDMDSTDFNEDFEELQTASAGKEEKKTMNTPPGPHKLAREGSSYKLTDLHPTIVATYSSRQIIPLDEDSRATLVDDGTKGGNSKGIYGRQGELADDEAAAVIRQKIINGEMVEGKGKRGIAQARDSLSISQSRKESVGAISEAEYLDRKRARTSMYNRLIAVLKAKDPELRRRTLSEEVTERLKRVAQGKR
jgi:hypothetical protein